LEEGPGTVEIFHCFGSFLPSLGGKYQAMKFLTSQFYYFFKGTHGKRSVKEILRLLILLLGLVLFFSSVFQLIMHWEGQNHSWFSGLYWTLVTMSTLGYGDIVFTTDGGRMFSLVVIMSGLVSLLAVLPFSFIKFFYEPWIEAQAAARAPQRISEKISGHVILTNYDPMTHALIHKLDQYGYPYVLVVHDLPEALRLHDAGIRVMVGDLDSPVTFQRVGLERAALVAATSNDFRNTNIAFTVREITDRIPVITTANSSASVDILQLAGSSHVVQLGKMMGEFLARRTIGGDARAHVIGQFDQLVIAEATAAATPLVGKTVLESRLRDLIGVTVVGVWERGHFETPTADTRISANTVLVLAGSREQIRRYDELFCIYQTVAAPVLIVGGGRVGRATGESLKKRGLDYRIIEERPERIRDPENYLLGNAAELQTLELAGIREAPAVIITTHEDDTNIYLTIYCRKLRPDIQIISRSTRERNVSTLHRAGADFVMSYASMGANTIFNLLKRSDIVMVAEGLNVFRVKLPEALAGRSIAESGLRQEIGCSIIAVHRDGNLQINPDPNLVLMKNAEIILIGSVEAEDRFLKRYAPNHG
jgi:voltage-gated potassium channel